MNVDNMYVDTLFCANNCIKYCIATTAYFKDGDRAVIVPKDQPAAEPDRTCN